MNYINVMKLKPEAITPTRSHKYDAGLDLYAVEDTSYKPGDKGTPGDIIKVSTAIAVEIPPGFVGLIRDRSSISTELGLKVTAGVIDAGYTGEVNVCFLNVRNQNGCLQKGRKIAQLLIVPIMLPKVNMVDKFESSSGRSGQGFGSTGAFFDNVPEGDLC